MLWSFYFIAILLNVTISFVFASIFNKDQFILKGSCVIEYFKLNSKCIFNLQK